MSRDINSEYLWLDEETCEYFSKDNNYGPYNRVKIEEIIERTESIVPLLDNYLYDTYNDDNKNDLFNAYFKWLPDGSMQELGEHGLMVRVPMEQLFIYKEYFKKDTYYSPKIDLLRVNSIIDKYRFENTYLVQEDNNNNKLYLEIKVFI